MAEFKDDHSYMMPGHFGGRPGGMGPTTYWDTVSATIRYSSDGDALSALLPPGFELDRPEVMVTAIMNRGVEWMAGEPYNIIAVNLPATFKCKVNVCGWYSLVVWENKTTPILTGREQTGIPKVYSEVEDFRFLGNEMRTWAHYAGHSFCDLHFTDITAASADERSAIEDEFSTMDWMAWRYIPKPGESGGASLSEPTIYPQEFEITEARVAKGTCEWSVPPLWKNPNQVHIMAYLSSLPIREVVGPAVILNARNTLRGDKAGVLA